jgi:hypothetical protein
MRLTVDLPEDIVDKIAEAVVAKLGAQMPNLPASSEPAAEILDTVGAAGYLKLSKQRLESLRLRGGGPKFVKLQRSVRYRRTDLDAWLGANIR